MAKLEPLSATVETPARVKTNIGFTANLGDFSSARCDFGLEDTVRADESTEQAFRRIYDECEAQLIAHLQELSETVQREKPEKQRK